MGGVVPAAAAATVIAALAGFAAPVLAQTAASLDCGLEAGPERAVTEVIDGDTIRLDDGKEVRLIGLIAPRAEDAGAKPGTWAPEEESRKALAALLSGKTIALAFQGPRTDRYGRVLAQLFFTQDGTTSWVQALHLESGHARAFAPPGHDACHARLRERERKARTARSGLWNNAAYQVRPADRPGELERYRGTFQIVSGRAGKPSGTRALVILEFVTSEMERPGGSSTVARKPAVFRAIWNRSVRTLDAPISGADLEIRGWIDVRRGPEIQVLGPAQLEVMTAAGSRNPPIASDQKPRP